MKGSAISTYHNIPRHISLVLKIRDEMRWAVEDGEDEGIVGGNRWGKLESSRRISRGV